MNREVKKRRKRFWAMCLAALLMFGSLPMEALAAVYKEDSNTNPVAVPGSGTTLRFNNAEQNALFTSDSTGGVFALGLSWGYIQDQLGARQSVNVWIYKISGCR